jgi:DNA-binding NarL/FixJ family response regulator
MNKRVLIADDNDYVRTVIRTFLQDVPDIEICGEAVDGQDAVNMASDLKADLVLLDLSMPTLNGAQVTSILKNKMPEVRIILFTMHTDKIGEPALARIGADAVLSKPNGMAHLVESIHQVFAAPSSTAPRPA